MCSFYRNNLGFTLLEAMVAIVVLTMGMFAMYSWVNVNILSLARTEQIVAQEILIEELIEELLITDLATISDGEVQANGQSIKWSAEVVERRGGVNTRGIVGLYDHTLYEVNIEIFSARRLVAEHTTRLVSSEQVRQPNLPL